MKTTNNRFALATLVMAALLFSFGCSEVSVEPEVNVNGSGLIGDTKVKARKSFSHTVDLTSQTILKVEGINGSVNVESVMGTNQVSISGGKIVSSDTYQDASSHLKDITIEISELSNELLVKTLQPQYADGRSYTVNYTINVPSNLSVIVSNINGDINGRVNVPINGTVDLRLINGIINLNIPQNTSANLSASLVNGIISVHNLTLHNRVATGHSLLGTLGDGQGEISLNTTNGIIDVLGY
ncbi:MAG: hypothetical protein WBH40_12285 [Ignavibacteriaceae bacterium]